MLPVNPRNRRPRERVYRGKVEERDRGVCAKCGRDTLELARKLTAILERFYAYQATWHEKKRALRWEKLLRRLKLTRWTCRLRHLWEADHVVPVVEGGPNALENLRTLCLPCHKSETRVLAARRARARRKQLDLAVGEG